jgi:ubiquinone biosynthesis protein COQ4
MTATTHADNGLIHHLRRPHHDWRRGVRALRRLIANKEDTSQVFEIFQALNGNAYARDYARLLSTAEGGVVAYERGEISDLLTDPTFVAKFPPGSVGAAYVHYLETEHLSAQGLIDESHNAIPIEEMDRRHPYAWFFRRIRDVHDIWHILTGYGRDALGETCLVVFSYEETRAMGLALIGAGLYLRAHGPAAKQARKAMVEAYRNGKRAGWLPAEDYDRLLMEPLEDARRRLNIPTPTAYNGVPPELRDLTLA